MGEEEVKELRKMIEELKKLQVDQDEVARLTAQLAANLAATEQLIQAMAAALEGPDDPPIDGIATYGW